ncbi:MAG: hypothetical protein HYT16_01100 [DPANN group archaeon]|nr:hypothetical protein [DPANN group archaeon]
MKNMFKLIAALLASLLLIAPAFATTRSALALGEVDFEDTVAPSESVAVSFVLSAGADVKDIKITGQIAGEKESRAELHVSKMLSGNERELKLTVSVPNDLREGTYRLTLNAEGKANGIVKAQQFSGNLFVEQKDHSVYFKSIQISSASVTAGDSIDLAVRLVNNGKNAEDSLKIKAEMPEVGASQTIRVTDTLMQEDDRTLYMTLSVPRDAESGLYVLKVTASNADVSATNSGLVEVQKFIPASQAQDRQTQTPVSVQVPIGKGAVVSLAVSNNEDSQKTFNLQLGGTVDWASAARVDPTTVTLGAGESESVFVYLLPSVAGRHSFTLFLKDGATTVSAVPVDVQVSGSAPSVASGLADKDQLGLVFVVVVVLLAVIAAFWATRRGSGKGQVYY